jgi:hypothetical protein
MVPAHNLTLHYPNPGETEGGGDNIPKGVKKKGENGTKNKVKLKLIGSKQMQNERISGERAR